MIIQAILIMTEKTLFGIQIMYFSHSFIDYFNIKGEGVVWTVILTDHMQTSHEHQTDTTT